MKYIFISDFFENEVNGGAELYDANLRKLLNSEYETKKCIQVNFPFLEKNKQNRFIISNFINLQPEAKKYLIDNCNYIIVEHDHKYLRTRDPSIFKDYVAPKDYIINYDFYAAAKAVVCQTELHATVVRKNLGLSNIVNFGGSIWSDDELNHLDDCEYAHNSYPEYDGYAYQVSPMPNKGTLAAKLWVEKENVKSKPIEPCDWRSFINQLAGCEAYVFFPTVLETCSRVSVEARMLGLKVIGNSNISALKEDWFKKYKGKELIDYFRNKNKSIPEFINSCFSPKKETINVDGDITVILNLYKRPQNLQKQIDAFRNQTVKPKEIWVWQNCPDQLSTLEDWYVNMVFKTSGVDHWITSDTNWGVYGRFTMAQMAKTKFICINDDDTIPGPRWLETCLESFKTNPGLQGGIGVKLHGNDYANHSRIGWAEPRPTTEEVDLVGHSWFFPKEYLKYIWMEEPFTWNMEDAHFSYCLQKYANIKTFVPPQIEKDRSSSILGYELGIDENAMSHPKNHEKFYLERNQAIQHYLNNGWKKVIK